MLGYRRKNKTNEIPCICVGLTWRAKFVDLERNRKHVCFSAKEETNGISTTLYRKNRRITMMCFVRFVFRSTIAKYSPDNTNSLDHNVQSNWFSRLLKCRSRTVTNQYCIHFIQMRHRKRYTIYVDLSVYQLLSLYLREKKKEDRYYWTRKILYILRKFSVKNQSHFMIIDIAWKFLSKTKVHIQLTFPPRAEYDTMPLFKRRAAGFIFYWLCTNNTEPTLLFN